MNVLAFQPEVVFSLGKVGSSSRVGLDSHTQSLSLTTAEKSKRSVL